MKNLLIICDVDDSVFIILSAYEIENILDLKSKTNIKI